MVVIVTAEAQLAKDVSEAIDGEKSYVLRHMLSVPPVTVDDDDPDRHEGQIAMRAAIYPKQPATVILDVRFGGNEFRAMRSVPKILSGDSGPAVILIAPSRPRIVVGEAARLGCFEVISLSDRLWRKKLARAVLEAKAARKVGALDHPRRRARGSLH
jgi:hypothetical protein